MHCCQISLSYSCDAACGQRDTLHPGPREQEQDIPQQRKQLQTEVLQFLSGVGACLFTCQNWHIFGYHFLPSTACISTPRISSEASKDKILSSKFCLVLVLHCRLLWKASWGHAQTSTPADLQYPQSEIVIAEGLGMRLCMHLLILHYARYLGLGRRYEAGICTIVISMNRAFQ